MELLLPALIAAAVVAIAKVASRPKPSSVSYPEVYVPEIWIGQGWTNWPYKDKYPTEGAVAGILVQLGYDPGAFAAPGYQITSVKGQDAVAEFQSDANAVYNHAVGQGRAPSTKFITVTGFVDPPTYEALLWALTQNWQQIRDKAYGP